MATNEPTETGLTTTRSAHCCADMADAVSTTCEAHGERHNCPDALLTYVSTYDEYGIIIHDGGSSFSEIRFCPYCGARLPDSKRDLWLERLDSLGLDPASDTLPIEFQSDAWWRKTTSPPRDE